MQQSDNKEQLDKYLDSSFRRTADLDESKRFEQQALKSGFNHLDTQKLMELVNKYDG